MSGSALGGKREERMSRNIIQIRAICGAFVICLMSPGVGGAAVGLDEALISCRAISEDAARLSCYDKIIAPKAQEARALDGASAGAAKAPSAANFGSDVLPPPALPQPQSLTAKINGHINGFVKGQVLFLDNGQQWRVVDDRAIDFVGDSPSVRLDRSFSGTYWLELIGEGQRFKVRRIR